MANTGAIGIDLGSFKAVIAVTKKGKFSSLLTFYKINFKSINISFYI